MSVSREKLFEECWTEPMTKVAARYGVSSSYLARICEQLNVPRPPRGYWVQLGVGKAPPKPELPDATPAHACEWRPDEPFQGPRLSPTTSPHAPNRVTQKPKGKRPEIHELISGARIHFDKTRRSDNGYLRPFKHALVDLYVSRESLARGLELANQIFLAIETEGHTVSFGPSNMSYRRAPLDERMEPNANRYDRNHWAPDRPTLAFVGEVAFGLTLFELSENVEARYSDGVYVRVPVRASRRVTDASWTTTHDMPSGRFCLRAYSPYHVATWQKEWREDDPGDLRHKIPEIAKQLEGDASYLAKLVREGQQREAVERERLERQWAEWKAQERERQDAEHRKNSRNALTQIIEAWRFAKSVEEFFADVTNDSGLEGEAIQHKQRIREAMALLGETSAALAFQKWKSPQELAAETERSA